MDAAGVIATETIGGKPSRPRDRMLLQAMLRLDGSTTAFAIRVRNISAGGLMAEAEAGVGVNARVTIELRSVGEVAGTVAWVNDQRFGVSFDVPIDPKRAREQPKVAPEAILSRSGFRKITHPLG